MKIFLRKKMILKCNSVRYQFSEEKKLSGRSFGLRSKTVPIAVSRKWQEKSTWFAVSR